MKTVNVGLLGCGNVGMGFVRLVERAGALVAARTGVTPRIVRVGVRDASRPRQIESCVDRARIGDADSVLSDPTVAVVVELIGGIEPAKTYVLRAIESGRHVVTANKALLAEHGAEIFRAAARRGVRVAFEASVCGGLPVLRALTLGLVANRIDRIWGIVNGTSNFILSAMEDGASFDASLDAARACGLAEADPSLDIDGHDALQKLQILVGLGFGFHVGASEIPSEEIRHVTREDVSAARDFGCVLRHVVQADRLPLGLWLSSGPVLLPERHPLAWSRDEFNALLVRGDAVGETIFTGRGAGAIATASAVLADVVDVATSPQTGHEPPVPDTPTPRAPDRRAAFYIRLPVRDPAAAPGAVAAALAHRGISADVPAVVSDPRTPGRISVRVLVHETSELAVRAAAVDLAELPCAAGRTTCIPFAEPRAAAGGRGREASRTPEVVTGA